MPDTRPGITFNEEGVCSACTHYEHRKDVDWAARWKEFEALASMTVLLLFPAVRTATSRYIL